MGFVVSQLLNVHSSVGSKRTHALYEKSSMKFPELTGFVIVANLKKGLRSFAKTYNIIRLDVYAGTLTPKCPRGSPLTGKIVWR